ncbi:MAG: adenylate/guanylate cyclase domain-containing protein, partial [Betaproteobacteria bacterium]|nr:adenylate/guanylate cyclase domain-containing protein [Betaproteobacteria bacterium]
MLERQNRTSICSVVFLDIVEYSRKPVAEQIRLKERFNALLSEALGDIAINDRIILDTGDGAAISFLGDPEDALFVALAVRDGMAGEAATGAPQLQVRMGINLGPVRLVKDINGQPNIIGDGINVGQRVMSFAQPGQILVSRSYHEVVSCLSKQYAQLFRYEGSRTDKHVREHEVYAVGDATPGVRTRPAGSEQRAVLLRGAGLPLLAFAGKGWSPGMAIAVSATVALVLASAAALRVYKQASKAPESIVSAQSAPATAAPPGAESDVKKGRPAPPSSASGKPGPGRAETTVL